MFRRMGDDTNIRGYSPQRDYPVVHSASLLGISALEFETQLVVPHLLPQGRRTVPELRRRVTFAPARDQTLIQPARLPVANPCWDCLLLEAETLTLLLDHLLIMVMLKLQEYNSRSMRRWVCAPDCCKLRLLQQTKNLSCATSMTMIRYERAEPNETGSLCALFGESGSATEEQWFEGMRRLDRPICDGRSVYRVWRILCDHGQDGLSKTSLSIPSQWMHQT